MAESIIDRLQKMAGGVNTSALPGSNRAFLEALNPYNPFAKNLRENLAKAEAVPTAGRFSGAKTIGGQLLQGLGNLGLLGTDVIVKGGAGIAAPLAAVVDTLGEPTYQEYIDTVIAPQLRQIDADAARYRGLASMPRRMNLPPAVGGPDSMGGPTEADQRSAIEAQKLAAQQLSDEFGSTSYMGEDFGPGAFVPGDIFDPTLNPDGGSPMGGTLFGERGQIDPRDRMGGTLFGDAVNVTPAQAQETAGILTKLIQDSATRGGAEAAGERAETAVTDGEKSGTTVQGDVTDITDQPDDLVETDPRFGAETETTTRSFGPDEQTTEQKKSNLYKGLFKEAFDNYNTLLDKAPSGAKTMEEYKKEFSDATGIDITGQPDNSAALTAFGLALMQNKAGKGFDVGKLLSETGKAGEKALPLMAQARKEAREAQIAAGQYALGATKEDRAARAKSLDEATKYLVGRRDTILDQQRSRIEAIEDFDMKRIAELELETLKAGFESEIEWQKTLAEANEPNFKVGNVKDWQPLGSTMPVKITMGIKEKNGRPVFLYPAEQAESLGQALADVTDGMNSLDSLRDKIIAASRTPAGEFAGISGQKAYEVYQQWASSLGYEAGAVPQFDKKGKYIGTKREMPIQEADAIRQRLIAQFKRFLTQETGNGISNVDVQNIENLLGQINFLTDPQGALNRLEEVRVIFQSSQSKINGALKKFDNRDRYQTPEEYDLARQAISEGINRAYYKRGTIGGSVEDAFNVTVEDGIQVYDFTQ